MNKNNLIKTAVFVSTFVSSSAFAHIELANEQCDVSLNYDLSVSPEHIRIIDNDKTMIDIYKDQLLFVKGDQIELSAAEQKLIGDYSASIRQAVPEVAKIATEAVSIAYHGINTALGQHVDLAETETRFNELKNKIDEKFNSKNGHYSFYQGEFNTNADNKELEMMVEDIVEDMVPKLIGSLMMNIGSAMSNGETSFKDLENLGDRIEQEIEGKAEALEQRANRFCNQLKQVDKMEEQLVAVNSKFAYFDLLKVN